MRRLLSRGRQSGAESTNGRFWREVPKLNLLVVGRRRPVGRWLLKSALTVAILGTGFVALALMQQQSQTQADITARSLEQLNVQEQLATRTRAIEQLRGEVAAAREQAEAAERSVDLLAQGRINWFDALTALFDAQVEGIQLTSISIPDPGIVKAVGTAADPNAIARFRWQIDAEMPLLRLQGMTVEQEENGSLSFSALVRLGQQGTAG